MEAVEAVSIGLAQDPLDLHVQGVARRRPIPGVHLEILRHGLDTLPENLKQRRIRGLGGHHRTWQQHHAMPSRHAAILRRRRSQGVEEAALRRRALPVAEITSLVAAPLTITW